MYKEKYLKYKKKYLDLLQLYGGEFRTNIDNCEKINNFIKEFISIIKNNTYNNNKSEIEIKITKINELYVKYLDLFASNELNMLILSNLNYLFGIKLSDITNSKINEIISNIYTKKQYNENPIKFELDTDGFLDKKCLQDIQTWYKPYLIEDFWKCDINEFMNEYDNFENSHQLMSYLLFWTNVINISSLLCRIKTCNYYFIKVDKNSKIPTFETYDKMLSNNEIVKMTDTTKSNGFTDAQIKLSFPKTKLIFTYLEEFTNNEFDDLVLMLAKCFDCEYSNLLEFYLKFICLLNMKENHNCQYNSGGIGDLIIDIKKICEQKNTNLSEYNILLYPSLNLPKDNIYARNEYTNMICSSLNSLYLIDNIPLSMTQIIGHDYYFHRGEPKKINYSDEVKYDFRNLIKYLEKMNAGKEIIFSTFKSNIQQIRKSFKYINEDFVKFRTEFINNYVSNYENYDYLNFLEIVHYIFHEQNIFNQCFSKKLFIDGINDNLDIKLSSGIDNRKINYLLNILAFVLSNNFVFNQYFRVCKNFFKIISNIFNMIIVVEYTEKNNIQNDFIKMYFRQLIETNECLVGDKKIIFAIGN